MTLQTREMCKITQVMPIYLFMNIFVSIFPNDCKRDVDEVFEQLFYQP